MTLQASGAISFTNLKDEYGGASTNIKLSNYAAKYENHGAGAHLVYYLSWTGYHLRVNTISPPDTGGTVDSLLYGVTHDTTITFLLDSSVTVPVYLRSTYGIDNSNLITTGVSNNGSAYNASSAYHTGVYTAIIVNDCGAALGNDGQDINLSTGALNGIYIMTNQTQVQSASDSTVAYNVIQVDPSTNRNVIQRTPTVDLAFPSSLAGGSEESLVGGGTYFSISNASNSFQGLVKNGKSITMKGGCAALSPGPVTGNFNASINCRIYGYPITRTDSNNNTHGQSFGSFGNILFGYNVNPFPGWTNNASSMASFYASNLSTSPLSSSLGTGWTASWSSSGGDLICTLTNNTGSDYLLIPQQSSDASKNLPWILVWPGSDFSYYYTQSSNQCDGAQSQRYGQNLFSRIVTTLTQPSSSTVATFTFLGYHTNDANRAAVIADLLQLYNEYDIQGVNGADYRDEGISVGNGYGLQGRILGVRATEPTTGTLRIHYRAGANSWAGGKITSVYSNYHYASPYAGPTYGSTTAQGATNFAPTITYPDGVYDGNANEAARLGASNRLISTMKYNMKMSEYYAGKA